MTFHRFAFMTRQEKEADLRPHELRDGDAFARLVPALMALGYGSGPLLINHPLATGAKDTSMARMSSMSEQNLLVVTSRPPLDEERKTGKRVVKASDPSENEFEQQVVVPALRRYLDTCSRDKIVLTLSQAARLEQRYRNRQSVKFFLKANEQVKRHEASYKLTENDSYEAFTAERTTAAYLIHTPPLLMPDGRKGPRVLTAFGLSGTIGLIFANQLTEQKIPAFQGLLEDTLRGPGFAMVEITVTRDVPEFYMDLDFSDEWEYRLITKRPGT